MTRRHLSVGLDGLFFSPPEWSVWATHDRNPAPQAFGLGRDKRAARRLLRGVLRRSGVPGRIVRALCDSIGRVTPLVVRWDDPRRVSP